MKKYNDKTNPIAYFILQGNMSAMDPVEPPDFEIIDLTGGDDNAARRNEEEFALEADIQHNIEEELEREAENQRHIDEQRQIEEQHQQQEQLVQAAQQVIVVGDEQNRVEGANRVRLRLLANEMRAASATRYLPPETLMDCVIKERYSIMEAIVRGGDHRTPCQRCSMNDPDECFWILRMTDMNMEGRMIKQGRGWLNNQVRHYLYGFFIEKEYSYLLDEIDEDNIENRNRLPRLPLPCCVERYIKRLFPNEDGRPFVGFRRPSATRRGRNRRGQII